MERFCGTMQGQQGEASWLGVKSSDIVTTVNGWESGVQVRCWYNKQEDNDFFLVSSSRGSNSNPRYDAFATVSKNKVEILLTGNRAIEIREITKMIDRLAEIEKLLAEYDRAAVLLAKLKTAEEGNGGDNGKDNGKY